MQKKKLLLYIILLLLLGLSINLGYATLSTDNTIKGSLIINYGETIAKSNQLVLNLEIGSGYHSSIASVQFSLDNINWYGYNASAALWQKDYASGYQPFYNKFPIGDKAGPVKVYVRIRDTQGKYSYITGEINYSPENASNADTNISEALGLGLVNKQAGTRGNPFYISRDTTALTVYTQGVKAIAYAIEGGQWSSWRTVSGEQTTLNLVFDGSEGSKVIYLRTQNQFGEESDIKEIHYYVDKKSPELQINSDFHSFVAVDGKIYFDIILYDAVAEYIDYTIEITMPEGKKAFKEGRSRMQMADKSTINTINIEGLPKGAVLLKITARDEAGNTASESINIDSR